MTILNRPSDGLFNILIVIYKTLALKGGQSRERLESVCAPGEISKEKIGQTLNRWTQLGLFEDQDGKFSIVTEFKLPPKKISEEIGVKLPLFLRKLVFSETNNENFWDSAGSLSADFTRGIAWLLAQDIYSFPTMNHDDVQEIENQQFTDTNRRMLQNDTRWSGLKEWAIYLGFGWDGKHFVIDPTAAIQESLPIVFGNKKSLTVGAFLDSLAKELPVVDFGKYRLEVEKFLNIQRWSCPPKFHISSSLSRAIKRLEVSGLLRLDYQSDAGEAYRLIGQGGNDWGSLTHVVFNS